MYSLPWPEARQARKVIDGSASGMDDRDHWSFFPDGDCELGCIPVRLRVLWLI